jgi:hypothetical protein
MDILKSKTISILEIPAIATTPPRKMGRLGELWEKLLALENGEAEAVENRDWAHGTMTMKRIQEKARGIGRKLNHKRNDTVLYLWLDAPKEAADE